MTGRAIVASAFFAAALGHANAGDVYSVTFNTSDFDTSGNPYELDVNLTASNGVGDASSVTLDNFSCNGCPAGPQTLTDSSFTQDLYIPFTAGGTVAFDLTLSPDLTYLDSDGPDSFQLSILDQSYNPISTTDPFDAVLFAALDSANPSVASFGTPDGSDPSFAAPVVQAQETPEPDSAVLMALAFTGFVPLVILSPALWLRRLTSFPSRRRRVFRCAASHPDEY